VSGITVVSVDSQLLFSKMARELPQGISVHIRDVTTSDPWTDSTDVVAMKYAGAEPVFSALVRFARVQRVHVRACMCAIARASASPRTSACWREFE
jgi:hypothetical protein